MAFASHSAVLSRARDITSSAPPVESPLTCATETSASESLADEVEHLPGTKVIATIGPGSRSPATLDALLAAGVSCFRLDVSSARPIPWLLESYDLLQDALCRSRRLCAVVLDTKGPLEVTVRRPAATPRAGSVEDQGALVISAEQTVILSGDLGVSWSPETPDVLPLSDPCFLDVLAVGDLVHVARYLSSGMERSSLFLEVLSLEPQTAVCRALTPAVLEGLITVARASHVEDAPGDAPSPHACAPCSDSLPSCLCSEDRETMAAFAGKQVDFLALSYTESAEQVAEARALLDSHGMSDTAILAKVETRAGLQNFEAVLAAADGIIISRGNLGWAVPIEKVARLQKEMIWRSNLAGKPCVVTRILDSMTDAPRPTRAEATDVANAVLDGVDAFMLGAETVRGQFPVEAVTQVCKICCEAERVFDHARFFYARMDALEAFAHPDESHPGLGLRASMASTLVRVADKTAAKLLIVFTKSGRHAAEVAVWRPGVPILALFPPTLRAQDGVRWAIGGRAEARRAMLLRDVIPMLADPKDGLSEDAMLASALAFAESSGLVRHGDVVALSHKLRDDISISVLSVGEQTAHFPSSADLTSLERTPSAYDLAKPGTWRQKP